MGAGCEPMQYIKEHKKYLLAFFIPLVLLLLAFFCLLFLYPDGRTIFVSDMDAQYKSLLLYFREHLWSGYSFSKGLGGGMLGTNAYYLMSPFNLITLLFSKENIHIAILVIITLKLCLSGFTMYIFLKRHSEKNKWLLVFSTSYVFMAFVVNYIYHIMWFDAFYMLPLILLGIDHIIKGKKGTLYFFSLFYTILTHYYMGFIVAIFSLLYFIYQMVLNYTKKDKKIIQKRIQKFLGISFVTGFTLAFFLLPVVLDLASMQGRGSILDDLTVPSIVDVISKLFIGSQNDDMILAMNQFQLYIGVFPMILVFLYFLNPSIKRKEKYASMGMIMVFILSIFIKPIDYAWYAFTLPNCFSGRYTFALGLFLLLLALRSFERISFIEKREYFLVAPIYPILGIVALFSFMSYVRYYLIWGTVFLSFLYLLLLYYKDREKNYTKKIYGFIFLLVCSELVLNMFFSIRDYDFVSKKENSGDYIAMEKGFESVKKKDTSSFYRMEKNLQYSSTDSFAFDYNGVYLFLSTVDKRQMNFLGNMGFMQSINISEYDYRAPVVDALLGIRYTFSKDIENEYYEKIGQYEISTSRKEFYNVYMSDVYIYKNKQALELGTMIKNPSSCNVQYKDGDRLAYQNAVIDCLYGEKTNIYRKIPIQKESDTIYTFENTEKKDIYLFPSIEYNPVHDTNQVTMSFEGANLGRFTNILFSIQKFVNKGNIGRKFTIEMEAAKGNTEKIEPYAYYFDEEAYQKTFQNLRKNSLKILEKKDGYLKGSVIGTEENSYLFTTIPYHKGWSIWLDGKKVKYDAVFDMFIGLEVGEGNHTLVFKYQTPGFKEGIFISTLTVIGIFTFLGIQRRSKQLKL